MLPHAKNPAARDRDTVCTHMVAYSVFVCLCSLVWVCTVGEKKRNVLELSVALLSFCDWWLKPIIGLIRLCLATKEGCVCLLKVNKKRSQSVRVLFNSAPHKLVHSKLCFLQSTIVLWEKLCKKIHGQFENVFSRNCHLCPTFPG